MNFLKSPFATWPRAIATGLIAGLVLLGLSVRITREENPREAVQISLPTLKPLILALDAYRQGSPIVVMPAERTKIVMAGTQRAEAATASDWDFVRGSATWANGNSTLADNIITSLKNSGLLANSGTFTNNNVAVNGVTYKIKLTTASSFTAASATVAAANTSYVNRFKMWRASDNKATLELLFNNVNSSNGVLLLYRLGVLGPTNSNNENLIVESYLFGNSPSRKQTYSWGAPFWTSGANAAMTSDRGRVILEEMTLGLVGGGTAPGLCVRVAARTVSFTSGCGTGNHYYGLAYGQKTGTNFETTAREGLGLSLAAAQSGNVCGFDILKFGTFNGSGFLADNQPNTSVGSGFPDPGNASYGVQFLYNKVNTVGAGANGYDDLSNGTLAALAPAFQTADDPP